MKPSEVFRAARDARKDIERIDSELAEMKLRIGPQGYSFGFHSKDEILNPMRHVDDLVDAEIELEDDKHECYRSIREARRLLAGLRILAGDDMADVVELYYVEGMTERETAAYVGQGVRVTSMMRRLAMEESDRIGYVRLKEASFGSQGNDNV